MNYKRFSNFLDFGDWLDISIREQDNQIVLTPEIPNLKRKII